MSNRKRKNPFKSNHVYSEKEVLTLTGRSARWLAAAVRSGLHPSDDVKPYVFQGSQLKAFKSAQLKHKTKKLRIGEFKCFSCREIFWPDASAIGVMLLSKNGNVQVRTSCDGCNSCVTKLLNATQWDGVVKCKHTNISLDTIDEGRANLEVKIDLKQSTSNGICYHVNDRLLHGYIGYMGKYAAKTVDAHLISIRDFEGFTKGVAFKKLTPVIVGSYREALIQRGIEDGERAIGKSTIRHRASHLRLFLTWLLKQKGYRILDKTIPDYLDLPKALMVKVKSSEAKQYPTLVEAVQMLQSMPVSTSLERRQRAIFACAFVTGLRANALAALRLRDIDLNRGCVFQDGSNRRAKNGKSFRVRFFPVTEIFSDVLKDWIDEIEGLGACSNDAVFPTENAFVQRRSKVGEQQATFEPLKNADSVRSAFQLASRHAEKHYTPHCARHCLVALGVEMCRTPKEIRAWSKNMGHEEIETTFRHYGHMDEETSFDVLEGIEAVSQNTDDDKELLIQFMTHKLPSTDPHFEKAMALFHERLRRE